MTNHGTGWADTEILLDVLTGDTDSALARLREMTIPERMTLYQAARELAGLVLDLKTEQAWSPDNTPTTP